MRRACCCVGRCSLRVARAAGCGRRPSSGCTCGKNPPGPPPQRTLKPYAQEPEDMQPFSKFTEPTTRTTLTCGVQRRGA